MSPESDLAAEVVDLVVRIHRRLRQEQAVHGLTGARLAVLTRLHEQGSQSLGSLAAAERVTPATMARIVDGLAQGKLVVRRPSPGDRRMVMISTTSLGRSLLAGGRRRQTYWLTSYLESLTEHERAAMSRATRLLSRALR
ncbi:MAG TPA: MarR family transcriptional regulator [Acidimicrobiia bacterium]|jgi:DNA-binding MarR family transcriptional regulator